ncbi:uncharacterized protein LOC131150429 isoform X2 [Malania oleifera]|uniref:uncharacterized protein LOC131150429 isoform X2 n=1 Tax=Malania oleifera TaxID=397392 RepID=UPI0025AE1E5B|nr:uncharacterized protein LOC131150429 isoform X2 [Malania oleifera]
MFFCDGFLPVFMPLSWFLCFDSWFWSMTCIGLPIIWLKINISNDNMESRTDLGLTLDNSSQGIQRGLNNNTGAGANAGCSADMTFVATDFLSELVWTPHTGLSLKCADCTLAKKKTSVLWGAEPSNMVLSLTKSNEALSCSKGLNEKGNLMGSKGTFYVKSNEVAERATSDYPSSDAGIPICESTHGNNTGNGDKMEHTDTVVQESVLLINQNEYLGKDNEDTCIPINVQKATMSETRQKNCTRLQDQEDGRLADSTLFIVGEPEQDIAQIDPLPRDSIKAIHSDPIGGSGEYGCCNHSRGAEVLASEVHAAGQYEEHNTEATNSTSLGNRDKELALFYEEKSKNKMKKIVPGSTTLEKLESTAENDLTLLNCEKASGAANKIIELESANEVNRSHQLGEEMILGDKIHSQKGSRIHSYERKGKGKSLSEGDANERMSKEEDDIHDSVESSNGARLSITGNKRWSLEEKLFGSKRVKKQMRESPPSTSFRQDSSFLNWISNVTKGFPKSDQGGTPFALTLPHPNHEHESNEQKNFLCMENQDSGCRMGFRSIFQSLYWPNKRAQDVKMLISQCETGEGSKKIVLANNINDVNSIPSACLAEDDNLGSQYLLPNEKFDRLRSGDEEGPSTRPLNSSTKFSAILDNCTINSAELRKICNPESHTEKDAASSSNSLGKRKTSSADNNDFDPQTRGKEIDNDHCRLGSLWITRFAAKTPGCVLNTEDCSQRKCQFIKKSTDYSRLLPCSQNHVDSFKDKKKIEIREYCSREPLSALGEELQHCVSNAEASFGSKRTKANNDGKFRYKLNPISPSFSFRSSEAIATVFGRRLDAFKHIIPSNETDNTDHPITACLFCGLRGHNLQDCPEIAESELEDLIRNIVASDRGEKATCWCVRCFQLNHWAVACPIVSSRKQHQLEYNASLFNRCNSSRMHLYTGNESTTKLLESKKIQIQVPGAHLFSTTRSHKMDMDPTSKQKMMELMNTDKVISNSKQVKCIASSCGESLKEKQITALCSCVNQQISGMPTLVFDTMKKLRVSRTDILKWMKSHTSLLPLDGFFLRLRLGNWKEGLGGTGYHVACVTVTGAQQKRLTKGSRNPISVNIGGVECLVESRNISNHDFLEDELMAWWCSALKAGGKVPSEEDLKLKLEERKKLGL